MSRTTIPQGSIKPLTLACLVQPDVDTNACTHAELRTIHVAIVGSMHRQRFAPCARSSYIRGNSICCAATCGGGESRRYRSIEIAPLGPGVPACPSTAETKDCNFQVRSILDTAALLTEAYAPDSAGLPGELYDLSMDELAAVFGELRWSRHDN